MQHSIVWNHWLIRYWVTVMTYRVIQMIPIMKWMHLWVKNQAASWRHQEMKYVYWRKEKSAKFAKMHKLVLFFCPVDILHPVSNVRNLQNIVQFAKLPFLKQFGFFHLNYGWGVSLGCQCCCRNCVCCCYARYDTSKRKEGNNVMLRYRDALRTNVGNSHEPTEECFWPRRNWRS